MDNIVLQALQNAAQTINAMAQQKQQLDFQRDQLKVQQQQFERTMSLREKEFAVRISTAKAESAKSTAELELEKLKLQKAKLDVQGDQFAKLEREAGLVRQPKSPEEGALMQRFSAYPTMAALRNYGDKLIEQQSFYDPESTTYQNLALEIADLQDESRHRAVYMRDGLLQLEQTDTVLAKAAAVDTALAALQGTDSGAAFKAVGDVSYTNVKQAQANAQGQTIAAGMNRSGLPTNMPPDLADRWAKSVTMFENAPSTGTARELDGVMRELYLNNPQAADAAVNEAIRSRLRAGQNDAAEKLIQLATKYKSK